MLHWAGRNHGGGDRLLNGFLLRHRLSWRLRGRGNKGGRGLGNKLLIHLLGLLLPGSLGAGFLRLPYGSLLGRLAFLLGDRLLFFFGDNRYCDSFLLGGRGLPGRLSLRDRRILRQRGKVCDRLFLWNRGNLGLGGGLFFGWRNFRRSGDLRPGRLLGSFLRRGLLHGLLYGRCFRSLHGLRGGAFLRQRVLVMGQHGGPGRNLVKVVRPGAYPDVEGLLEIYAELVGGLCRQQQDGVAALIQAAKVEDADLLPGKGIGDADGIAGQVVAGLGEKPGRQLVVVGD